MKLNINKLSKILDKQNESLSSLLNRAGVSRTAYYNIARSESLLPKSLQRIAEALGVSPSTLVKPRNEDLWQRQQILAEIISECPELDHSTAWHTLRYLDMEPEKRLERSLESGKACAAFRD